jgi:hypothetical protein
MRPRHWEQLSAELGLQLCPGPGFTLAGAQEMGLLAHLEALRRVAEVASKEYSIEQVRWAAGLRLGWGCAARRGMQLVGIAAAAVGELLGPAWDGTDGPSLPIDDSHARSGCQGRMRWLAADTALPGSTSGQPRRRASPPLQALDKMSLEWDVASLQVLEYRETGTNVIKVSCLFRCTSAANGPLILISRCARPPGPSNDCSSLFIF